jgi:hypothetical protein
MKAGRLMTVSADRWRNIAITLTIHHRAASLCPISEALRRLSVGSSSRYYNLSETPAG